MLVVVVIVFVLGGYLFMRRSMKREVPPDVQELGSRVGRSIHAAIPIRGIAGQSSADFESGPVVDGIGSEDHHILMVDARGRPVVQEPAPPADEEPPVEAVRSVATTTPDDPPPRRRRRRRRPAE